MTTLEQLQKLQPLQKVHYSTNLMDDQLRNPTPELLEVFRLCRSVPISIDLNGQKAIQAAAELANKSSLPLCLNFSPWAESRCPAEVPTPGSHELYREIVLFSQFLSAVKLWISDAAPVAAILLDDERYAEHGPIMETYRNALYDVAKQMFPTAAVEYYSFGGIGPCAYGNGWSLPNEQFTLSEKGDAWSVALYAVPQIEWTQRSFGETVSAATERGGLTKPVVPWIALGCGLEPQADQFHKWVWDWPYGYQYSNIIGRQVNNPWYAAQGERFGPWNRATHAVFYPGASGEGSGAPLVDKDGMPRATTWIKHFVAYVRGAHGVNSIEGL
ncbi:MAG: hypothetical protein WC655_16675 [Candidatus Hydrogenedentales bacterium]|jgi:hypothetical protein